MRCAFWILTGCAVCIVQAMLCHGASKKVSGTVAGTARRVLRTTVPDTFLDFGAIEPKSDAASQPKANETAPATAKPLLLLDDEPEDQPANTSEADNSRCHVCHVNFALEDLAVTHAREGIGCAKCHGECDAHIDDESWSSGGPGTPPEIMYPPQRIDSACTECHNTHDAPAAQVIQRLLDRCSDKARSTRIVCTECHGNHRVNPNLRKAWWDKKTGKPLAPNRREAPM